MPEPFAPTAIIKRDTLLAPADLRETWCCTDYKPFQPTYNIDILTEGLDDGLILVALEALDDHLQTKKRLQSVCSEVIDRPLLIVCRLSDVGSEEMRMAAVMHTCLMCMLPEPQASCTSALL